MLCLTLGMHMCDPGFRQYNNPFVMREVVFCEHKCDDANIVFPGTPNENRLLMGSCRFIITQRGCVRII